MVIPIFFKYFPNTKLEIKIILSQGYKGDFAMSKEQN